MGYFEKAAYDDKLAKKYNINKDDYTQDRAGGGRYDFVDDDAYKKAIKNAMRNDYDYRTSAEHMDGVDGKANFNDFAKYEREAVKLHRKAGNGGQYSSNKDITGVTSNLVRDFREQQAADFKDMYMNDINALRDELEEKTEESQAEFDPENFEHSDKVADAKSRLDKYKLEIGEDNIFSQSNNRPARSDDQRDAAKSFVKGYTSDLKDASNLSENKDNNLTNAISAIASYRQ
jgi:hypothetical protein